MAPLRSPSPNNRAGASDVTPTKHCSLSPRRSTLGQDGGQKGFQAGESRQRLSQIISPRIFFVHVMRSMVAADCCNVTALDRAPQRVLSVVLRSGGMISPCGPNRRKSSIVKTRWCGVTSAVRRSAIMRRRISAMTMTVSAVDAAAHAPDTAARPPMQAPSSARRLRLRRDALDRSLPGLLRNRARPTRRIVRVEAHERARRCHGREQ